MTILDAALEVLWKSGQPMSVRDIHDEIIRPSPSLYQFGARSPRSVLSGTLRNQVKKSRDPRLEEVSKGVYRAL